jgi:hypothetical protein
MDSIKKQAQEATLLRGPVEALKNLSMQQLFYLFARCQDDIAYSRKYRSKTAVKSLWRLNGTESGSLGS